MSVSLQLFIGGAILLAVSGWVLADSLRDLAKDLAAAFKQVRAVRAAQAQRRAVEEYLLAERPNVVHVGELTSDGGETFVLEAGWEFSLNERWTRHPYAAERFSDGEWRVFGYNRRELAELYARRSEFNVKS